MRLVVAIVVVVGCGFENRARDTSIDAAVVDAEVDAPPITPGWAYRKPITIRGSQIRGGPHTRFPVLVLLASDADLAMHAASDGHDIRFTNGSVLLPYERVSYASNGALHAWVRVPTLMAGADTTIYLEYGNANAPEQQLRAATWSEGYVGVWHLGDGSDSTANANTAVAQNGATIGVVAGRVGTGAAFDGMDDRLMMPNSASLDSSTAMGTISLWIYFEDTTRPSRQFIHASSNFLTQPRSALEWTQATDGDNYFYPNRGSGDSAFNNVTTPFTSDTWHHAALTLDFAAKAADLTVDGMKLALQSSGGNTAWAAAADPDDWLWASHPDYDAPFLGTFDEIRISDRVRSTTWLATEYMNQDAPGMFIMVGDEEPIP